MKDSFFKKLIVLLVIFVTYLFFFPSSIFAATFTFEEVPSSISDNESIKPLVNLSVSNSAGKSYFIRGVFFHPDNPTSYFGYTKGNDENWYNGLPSIDYTKFYKITMDTSNQWSGRLEFKPDMESSYFKGSGQYSFKLSRYTELGSNTWCTSESSGCNVAVIQINRSVTPTPTPIPTSIPTSTPIPTAIPRPTPTPKPTLNSTSTPTTKPAVSLLPTAKEIASSQAPRNDIQDGNQADDESNIFPSSILGASNSSNTKVSTNSSIKKEMVLAASQNNLPKIFFGIGIVFLIACGILGFRAYRKSKMEE